MDFSECQKQSRRKNKASLPVPVELIERLVLSLTNPGDCVFNLLRRWVFGYCGPETRPQLGCNIVEEYVEIAWERVFGLRAGVLKTRPMDKPVYDLPGHMAATGERKS